MAVDYEIVSFTLEDDEDSKYKKGGVFRTTEYAYNTPKDFKKLKPEEILNRRIHLINPEIDTRTVTTTKDGLTPIQREYLIRLMAIKKNTETFPVLKQEAFRKDAIYRFIQGKKDVKKLMEETAFEIHNDKEDNKLEERLDRLKGIPTLKELETRISALKGPMPTDKELEVRLKKLRGKTLTPAEEKILEGWNARNKIGGSKKSRKVKKRKTKNTKRAKRLKQQMIKSQKLRILVKK